MYKSSIILRRSSIPRVAIVYPLSVPWTAQLFQGLRAYAAGRGGWHLFTSPPALGDTGESALTLNSVRGWQGDAIIILSNDMRELRSVHKLALPVVNLASGSKNSYGIPRVMVDHVKAGRLAADHLLDRGLWDLAYYGWKGLWYSEQRCEGFVTRAEEAGGRVKIFLQDPKEETLRSWPERSASVTAWLRSLPHPTGIFAAQDYRALLIAEACQDARLRIPEDIAIIGMDNHETVCEFSNPTLSSVSRNSFLIGWETGALLERMMNGKGGPAKDITFDPDGVVMRQSTNRFYCEDPTLQAAVDIMRANLRDQFNIDELASRVGIGKRTLETRFRQYLKTSPHTYLTDIRIKRAQELMQMPKKQTIKQIATECGFATAPAFYTAFHRIVGDSPGHFRKSYLAKLAEQNLVANTIQSLPQ